MELCFARRYEQLRLGTFAMNALLDPIYKVVAEALVAAKMDASESLGSS